MYNQKKNCGGVCVVRFLSLRGFYQYKGVGLYELRLLPQCARATHTQSSALSSIDTVHLWGGLCTYKQGICTSKKGKVSNF